MVTVVMPVVMLSLTWLWLGLVSFLGHGKFRAIIRVRIWLGL